MNLEQMSREELAEELRKLLEDPSSSGDLKTNAPQPELLRTLVDHITAMVAYWDSALRCRFANRAYEQPHKDGGAGERIGSGFLREK